MKNLRHRIVAFVAGVLIGPAVVWAGLETGTYISDLVVTNPLSSDLASTSDDHIRLLKSTIKTTFPNINNAVTVTDEQLNAVGASGVTGAANPSATIGLSTINGSATTFLRSDGAPALSQAIAPTWSAQHIFSLVGSGTDYPTSLRSNLPGMSLREADGAASNQDWVLDAQAEQLRLRATDSSGTGNNIMTVDRTGTTVDTVAFPTNSSGAFRIGPGATAVNNSRLIVGVGNNAVGAAQFENNANNVHTVYINNAAVIGDNPFIRFSTESSGAGTERGSIDYNRAGGAVRYNTTSDQRLKKNIRPAGSARQLINAVPVDAFDWRENGTHVPHGFVAQRLNKVAPDCVSKPAQPSGKWQVEKSCLVPALIKYVQEQDARITRLEADAARRH